MLSFPVYPSGFSANRWFAFLQAVSARYQNRPSFIKIAADGPTSVTAEMSLPNEPADLCTWVNEGYTGDRLIGVWKQVFANYARIFPRQYFSLALYPPPPIDNNTKGENILFVGEIGTGKTHLATALGIAACRQGRRVRFYTAANLIHELTKARDERRLQEELMKQDLIVLDEVGLVPFSPQGSQLLFQFCSERYLRGSVIFTTNLEFPRRM